MQNKNIFELVESKLPAIKEKHINIFLGIYTIIIWIVSGFSFNIYLTDTTLDIVESYWMLGISLSAIAFVCSLSVLFISIVTESKKKQLQ